MSVYIFPLLFWNFFTQKSSDFIFGLFVGILTNFLTWWLLYHYIKPSIRFSPYINKRFHVPTSEDKSQYGYCIKIENRGWRPVIDVEIMVRIKINWPGDYLPDIWDIIYIPLSGRGEIVYRIPIIYPTKHKNGRRPSLRLKINDMDRFREKPFYPAEIKHKANMRNLLLEDILNLGANTTLEIIASGYDEFSGARKIFLSNRYTINDIKEGIFQPNGLQVIESPKISKELKKYLLTGKSTFR